MKLIHGLHSSLCSLYQLHWCIGWPHQTLTLAGWSHSLPPPGSIVITRVCWLVCSFVELFLRDVTDLKSIRILWIPSIFFHKSEIRQTLKLCLWQRWKAINHGQWAMVYGLTLQCPPWRLFILVHRHALLSHNSLYFVIDYLVRPAVWGIQLLSIALGWVEWGDGIEVLSWAFEYQSSSSRCRESYCQNMYHTRKNAARSLAGRAPVISCNL